jgi:hypothetical protein
MSRAGYYRFRQRGKSKRTDMELRSQMRRIALRWPAYGYRRAHAELLRQGWTVNYKRLATAAGGQSTVRAAPKVPARDHRLPDSRHGLPIYPNVAAGMVLTSIDQLGVAISPTV